MYFLQQSGIQLLLKTILQMYKSKSRPMIEYASIFHFHNGEQNEIIKLQNKFIIHAYPCKTSTLMLTLEMKTNVKRLKMRVNQLIWKDIGSEANIHQLSTH